MLSSYHLPQRRMVVAVQVRSLWPSGYRQRPRRLLPQSSSALRFIAGAAGFLTLR